eukprot:g1221.t1
MRVLTTFVASTGTFTWKSSFLFLPSIFAAGLGYWQLQRKKWKEDLLQKRLEKVYSTPVPLFRNLSNITLYDRVKDKGVFQEDSSIFIGPRIRTVNGMPQQGYVLITPFSRDSKNGQVVLVNRGWVPEAWKQRTLKSTDESTVNGLVVENEKPNWFVPKNEPNNGNWFFVDSGEIAQHCGLPKNTLLVHDLKDPQDRNLSSRQIHTHGKSIELNQTETYPATKEISDFVQFTIMPSRSKAII